jgi:hypothetical protein
MLFIIVASITLFGFSFLMCLTQTSSPGILSLNEPLHAQLTTEITTNSTGLSVINLIKDNQTLGGNVQPSDFSIIVGNLNSTNSTAGLKIVQVLQFINGTDMETMIPMIPGSFFLKDNYRMSDPITRAYNSTFSGDCRPFYTSSGELIAIGNITSNQVSSCAVERSLITK